MRVPGMLVAGLVVAVAAPADARADGVIRAEPTNRYSTPTVQIAPGEKVSFENADLAAHDVTSKESRGDGKRLFSSEIIDGGKSGPVNGTADLQPGQYAFFCSLHSQMKGTLSVTGEALPTPTPTPTPTPAPAPDTKAPEVTLAGTLRAGPIRRRGRVVLTARSTEAARLTLTARIGSRRVGRRGFRLPKGRRKIAIRLSRKGTRAVRRGRRLRVVAIARDAAGNQRRSALIVKLP